MDKNISTLFYAFLHLLSVRIYGAILLIDDAGISAESEHQLEC